MRRLWIALALLLALLLASLANAGYSQKLTGAMADELEQAQALAREGRWDRAEELTLRTYDSWQRHHFYFHTAMRHADTDQILRTFQAVLQYLDLQEMDQYAAANADLITQLGLLAEMEQASLVNVL